MWAATAEEHSCATINFQRFFKMITPCFRQEQKISKNQSQVRSILMPGAPIVHHFGCSVHFVLLLAKKYIHHNHHVCMNGIIRCSTCC